MSTIVFLMLFSKGIADVNVALLTTAKICGLEEYATYNLTNGDKTDVENGIFTETCKSGDNTYIDVDLVKPHYVHYVVVTEGAYRKELDGSLDTFEVSLFMNEVFVDFCSTFPSKSFGVGKEMRVNCKSDMATRVRISSIKNVGVSIAEIEVFSLAEPPANITTFYYGCFAKFELLAPRNFEGVMKCLQSCYAFQFAAIKNKTDCECGHPNKNVPVEPEHCNIMCDNKYCGGENYYSVYLVNTSLPYHAGCSAFSSGDQKDEPFDTMDECIDRCMRTEKDTLATMDAYIQAVPKTVCLCRQNTKAKWGDTPPGSLCTAPCKGSVHEYCGSTTGVTIFSIMRYRVENKSFQFFNCNGSMDRYGVCDKCKPFFEGPYCFGIVIHVLPNCEEYDPCAYVVNKICDDSTEKYECRCLPGYSLNKATEECEDINECSGEVHCPETTSSCVNLNGSFRCSCNPGFWQTSWFLCTEGEKPETSKLKVFLIILFIFLLIGLSIAGVYIWVFKKDQILNEAGEAKSVGGGGSIGGGDDAG